MSTSTTDSPPSHRAGPEGISSPDGDLPAGTRVGVYRVLTLLGRGGMGEVYEALDERLARPVALKRIAPSRRADGEARARFWREARALASLRHPGLVAVYEIGEDPRHGLFIAMERAPGRPLSELLDAHPGPLAPALAVHLARGLADALAAVHAAGLTHRDVKPGNALVAPDGVRLVDFGLARRMDEGDALTRTGALVGTPAYMAPEQLAGEGHVGPPSDVFALGALLYRMISGQHPFARDSAQATALAIAGGLKAPLATLARDLPTPLVALVERCLAPRAADRPPDAGALVAALDALAPLVGPARPEDLAALLAPPPAARALPDASPAPPLVTRGSGPPARAPRPLRPRWLAGLGLAAVTALAAFAAGSTTHDENTPPPTPSASNPYFKPTHDLSTPAAPITAPPPAALENTPLALPPRPVVLVLGLEAADGVGPEDADVVVEVLRTRLADAPEALVSVPRDVAEALLPEPHALTADLRPERLARPQRALGHVDLVLRGHVARTPERLTATLELVDTRAGRRLATLDAAVAEGPEAPVALGESLASATFTRLGVAPPAAPSQLSTRPEAWSALILARRAARGADVGAAREHLAWALRVDPGFGLARAEELALLRMEGDHATLVARGEALLAEPSLPPSTRAVVEALVALGRGQSDAALRALHAHMERFPYEDEAATLLMVLRAKDPELHDLDEVERVARRLLTLAPRNETAASRLVRALGIRGRAAEAERLYEDLGIGRDDPELGDVWTELDLFQGRFDDAARGFRRALEAEPGNLYAENMAIAADLLAGRCQDAARDALDRIERVTRLGASSALDWTWSLGSQALICAEAWDALDPYLERWAASSDEGRTQAILLRARALFARTTPDERARLEPHLEALLAAPDTPRSLELALLALSLRVESDLSTLEHLEDRGNRAALDLARSSPERLGWRQLARGARARHAYLAGLPRAELMRRVDAMRLPWQEVEGEGEAGALVDALARRAELLEEAGDPEAALGQWRELLSLGYARLWMSDLWVTARARVRALEGEAPP